jgi:putative salt-induced outer membrane protein
MNPGRPAIDGAPPVARAGLAERARIIRKESPLSPLNTAFARALALASLVSIAPRAHAADAPDGLWHGDIAIGGALASGNTSSKTLTGAADATRATATDKTSVFGNVNYGRNRVDGVETTAADQVRAGGRYDYNLSDAGFVFGGGSGETNKAAGLDSRFDLDSGLGYKVIAGATTTFDLFAGLGWSSARFVDGTTGKGPTGLVGEESTHKLSDTTTFKQRAEFHAGVNALGNLATFDASVATAIAGGWTLATALSLRYASKVPAGLKSTDTLLTVGFGYKF